jgi:siroheme synthase
VRLKGGDPFVFGRGGEEAEALIAAGIAFEVVPGITSAVGVPAYAGIPVTHRGLSASFTVVTGHREKGGSTGVNWEALAAVGGTIVVLMGVAERGVIAERLIAGGLSYNTPVAATRWGTRAAQETVRTTLGELGSTPLEAPCTIVIGAVAALNFSWRTETHTPELI